MRAAPSRSTSIRLGARRFEAWRTIASPPIPSSRRTSSRDRVAGRGSKKLWMTSIGRLTESRSWVSRLQVLRHRRHGVRALEGVAYGRAVADVAAEERRVRPVQRRDDPRAVRRRQHRLGEDRRRGVRHGVMDVEDVQAVVAADLGHLHRERQGVVRVLEQPVVVDHHGMVEEARRVRGEPEGPLVAYEVRLVPAAGELLAERRREDPAAADRRDSR